MQQTLPTSSTQATCPIHSACSPASSHPGAPARPPPFSLCDARQSVDSSLSHAGVSHPLTVPLHRGRGLAADVQRGLFLLLKARPVSPSPLSPGVWLGVTM